MGGRLLVEEQGEGDAMHADELPIDAALVRRLLTQQFPAWAELPIERVPSDGTVNAIFRLGDALAVRAPFVPGETGIRRQAQWTPVLAPALPVRVPAVRGIGVPTREYPSDWLVVDWLPGRTPVPGALADPDAVTDGLVGFIRALWAQDPAGAPDAHRWGGLARDDDAVRRALADVHEVDTDPVLRLWERALAAPPHESVVWVHDDLLPSNLLVDEAGWHRGIGWAIVQAVVALPYYRHLNAGMTRMALHALRELVADASA